MRPRHWLMGIALTTGTVAVLMVPALVPAREPDVDPLLARLAAADSRAMIREEMARRLHSRAVAARSASDASRQVTVRAVGPIPTQRIAAQEAAARQWFDDLGALPAAARLVVTLVPDSALVDAGVPVRLLRTALTTDLFVPGSIAADVCHLVVRIPAVLPVDGLALVAQRSSSALAPCAPYLRYGAPGAPIAAWLAKTRHLAFTMSAATVRDPSLQREEVSRARSSWDVGGRRIRACLAGADAACEAIVTRPVPVNRGWRPVGAPDGWIGTGRGFSLWQGSLTAALVMIRLTEVLGDDAMRAIWTGSIPLAEAVDRASGQSLAAQVRATLRSVPFDAAVHPAVSARVGGLPASRGLLAAGIVIALGLAIGIGGFERATGPTRG